MLQYFLKNMLWPQIIIKLYTKYYWIALFVFVFFISTEKFSDRFQFEDICCYVILLRFFLIVITSVNYTGDQHLQINKGHRFY